MQLNPSVLVAPVILPRPVAGFRRQVQASHPFFGLLNLLTTDASVNDSNSPAYTKYAATPGFGPKQKTIHAAGTKEISWSVGGEVTGSSLGLVNLLGSSARGVGFGSLLISQGNDSFFFDNLGGGALPWSTVTLSGNPNAGLAFSIEGKSTVLPVPGVALEASAIDTQVATWATGNDYVLSWSLSHNANLSPFWYNTPEMLPAYYRAGESEFTVQVTTSVVLNEYTLIKIGFGYVSLFEAVVTSRNRVFGDRHSPVTYQVSSTNTRIRDQNGYVDFIGISLSGIPPSGPYD